MSRRLEPRPETILSISACVPWPTDTMMITAAMPMITPSEVSALRIQLPRSAKTAVRKVSVRVMPADSQVRARLRATGRRASRRCDRRGGRSSASWVISTMVWPCWRRRSNSCITSSPVRESSAPVGSSASSSGGRLISARAIAHALLLAARHLAGPVVDRGRRGRPPRARRGRDRRVRAAARWRRLSGIITLCRASMRESRLKPWNTKPIFSSRRRASCSASSVRHVHAIAQVAARTRAGPGSR